MIGDNNKQPEVIEEEVVEGQENKKYSFPMSAIFIIGGIVLLMVACIIVIAVLNK